MVNVLHRSCSAQAATSVAASSSPSSSSASKDIVCNCEDGHCTKQSGYRSSIRITNNMFLMIMLVSLSYFTCCVSAWPILNHRRSFNIIPQQVLPADFDVDAESWVRALQPEASYELPLVPYSPAQDTYADYPNYEVEPDDAYVWPLADEPILEDEEPEELELEALKQQQPFAYMGQNKRRLNSGNNPTEKSAPLPVAASANPTSTPKSTESPLLVKSAAVAPSSSRSETVDLRKSPAVASMLSGQKEVAMLRPPSAKSHYLQIDEPEEPKISVVQRSPSNEKPSAYDRLRKVLSLDDALKKEYQQRRANANRHSKRESPSSIITDSDSLTGQLNTLKKKMD
ncbi:unnamed protein product [Orchesella dallaii]|uniref:Uncharacterized protein n=1 Tax=Orchesella dallaii TaxID=48710 RepID=A0ABP1Q5R2_9HEXA